MGKDYSSFLWRLKNRKETLQQDKVSLDRSVKVSSSRIAVLEQAQDVVNKVTILTLEEVRVFVEEAVSMCLATVYGEEYSLRIVYELKRGRSEASVFVVRGENKLDPRLEVGGGVIDVASIGLRLVLWMLGVPRSQPVFILDEPFRFVSRDLTYRIVQMLKEICDTFDAQVIMISHNSELIEGADRTVKVTNSSGVSSTCIVGECDVGSY